jgi:GNAT superfamily N-acetyltransferase
MSFTIRRVTAADYDDVRRITRDAYLHAGYFSDPFHPYVRILTDVEHRAEHAEVWVAEEDGTVIGSFAVTFEGQRYTDIAIAGELEFRMLAVDPAVQRGGFGRRMVEWIIHYARSLEGISAVSLTSGTDMVRAHRLYESLGFERVPNRDWWVPGTDIELWVFRLVLEPDRAGAGTDSTVPRRA